MWNCLYQSSGFSSIRQKWGVTVTPLILLVIARAAQSDLLCPTSLDVNRNCRFKFETSIVSMSITSMVLNPLRPDLGNE